MPGVGGDNGAAGAFFGEPGAGGLVHLAEAEKFRPQLGNKFFVGSYHKIERSSVLFSVLSCISRL